MPKLIDLTGQKFGELTVLGKENKPNSKKTYWKCKCSCGKEILTGGANLRSGNTKSCGCSRRKTLRAQAFEDLTGKKFSRLLVLGLNEVYEKEYPDKKKGFYWNCLCDCGKTCVVYGKYLKNGDTTSCGCLMREYSRYNGGFKDLTGQRFGKLTVINLNTDYKKNNPDKCKTYSYWNCQCDCGNTTVATSASLVTGNKISCGCVHSVGETIIQKLLEENNIIFEKQKSFDSCRFETGYPARFDFYINNDFLLEFDGSQHFYSANSGWNNDIRLEKTRKNDSYKNNWCRENNIPLKRIPYWVKDVLTIEDIMSDKYLIKE